MHENVMASEICQICNKAPATIDGKTKWGPWADMCDSCHATHGVGLGLGKGQRYDKGANG